MPPHLHITTPPRIMINTRIYFQLARYRVSSEGGHTHENQDNRLKITHHRVDKLFLARDVAFVSIRSSNTLVGGRPAADVGPSDVTIGKGQQAVLSGLAHLLAALAAAATVLRLVAAHCVVVDAGLVMSDTVLSGVDCGSSKGSERGHKNNS